MGGHDPITINILTIFPEFFETTLSTSIPGRAAEAGLVRYHVVDLRAFTTDRHQTVDDTPFGGGAGRVPGPKAKRRPGRNWAQQCGESGAVAWTKAKRAPAAIWRRHVARV